MATKTVYDDVFGFKRKSQTTTATLSPRIEDYAEIFGGFLRGATSIPVLDLPPADLVGVPLSFRGRCFDYSEVFGGVDEGEGFAVFEEVVKRCCDDDSDQAWTPAQSETLSDDLEPFACTNSYQSISNADFHPSSNDIKQFKVSYNKVFHTSEDDIANGVAHVAQLNDVPGYSFLVDEPPPLQKMVVTNNLKHEDFGVGIEEGKPSRETTLCDNKPFVTISDISLKTRPSHLPPPSRPPPVVGPKNRDNNTQSSKIKVSRSFSYEETTSADNSPLFYDVEVDASTSAAVSAAAMQDVMEKAQKKLKSAKYKKDRSKQASERDLGAVKDLADNSTKHGKGYGLLQESSNEGNVEWKQDEEFYEVTETNDHRNMISVRDNQRVGVHDFRASQVISQQEELNRKMKSDDGILEKIIVESVEGEGFVKMTKVRKSEDEDESKCKVHLGLEENGISLEENLEREAKERAQNEKRIKEKVEREEKEKTKREALEREEEEKRQKQARACELEAKILREANEKEENETRLRLVLEEKERERRLAWEREEKEKSEKDARERELEQNRLREAIEKEEAEKRLRLALEEKEKKLREVWEMEEKEKKERETREREDEEKRLQAAIEKEENEKRLRLALEENERKIRETQEKEKEEREKEAREREEKEKKENEDREREEKEKRENEAREREENERREKEALEREIEEMKLKRAHEENQKKQKEAYEREEKEKRDKKAREREIEVKVQREAIEQEENENRLKIALEKEENETERLSREKTEAEKRLKDDEMWLNTEGVPNSTLKNEENTEKVKEGCEQKEDAQVEEVYEREVKEKRSEEPFEHEAIDKMWEEDYRLDENIAICGAASKVDKDSGEAKTTNGLFLVKDTIGIEVQVGNLKSFGVAQGNLQHKNSEIRVDEAKESLHVHDIMFEFDKKPLKKTASLMKPNVVDYHLGERGATLKKVQEGKDKKDAKVKVQSQNPERKGKSLDDVLIREEKEREERMKREREQENERLRKIAEEREREKEREKDRMAVNMASLERENADTRLAEARERSEKANAEAKLRAERAAVERATAEARERAFQKAKAGKATVENRERIVRRTQSSLRSDSCQGVGSTNGSKNASSSVNGGVEVESAERCKARLERHQRTAQRAAKALEEKNMRDLLVLRELAERNRLAEGLDAEVKRWSSGKEGNLRALLSTLQYILGADSGWKPLHLTEVITSAAVKSAYRKATLCVHPDKLQQRGANVHQKYICEKVFDLLKAAWNKFNSEER